MSNKTNVTETKMQATHRRRIWKQTKRLWKENWVAFVLAWALSGVITIAAANADCSKIELGLFGRVLVFLMRTTSIEAICYVGIFYLCIGLIFYLSKMRLFAI